MPEVASRRHSAVSQQTLCQTCADLEAAGRQLTDGAAAALALLIEHHIDAHDATGITQGGCMECRDKKLTEGQSPLYAHWARAHYVMHELGIVTDTPYPRRSHRDPVYPMRFKDMPPPRPGR